MLSINHFFAQGKIETFLKPSDSLNPNRQKTVFIIEAATTSATLLALNQLWYKNYPKSKIKHCYKCYLETCILELINAIY